MCWRNSQAVFRSALSTSWVTANLLVRSMPTNKYSLPSAVCTSAMSMWKNPRVAFELRPLRLVALHIRQARDAMSLQTAVQRRSRQMRDRGLQSVKAVVQRQQRMAPKRHDHRLLILGQNRRTGLCRPCLHVFDRRALAPLRDGLGVNTQFPAQLCDRSLRSFGPALEPMAGKPSLLLLGQRAWSWRCHDELVP